MRTKTITIEEQEFTIAPLNLGQVDALMENNPEASDLKAWKQRSRQTVCDSLNNAHGPFQVNEVPGSMNPANLAETMDLTTFNALHSAVLELSGLKAATPGETLAAPDSTSNTSAAA